MQTAHGGPATPSKDSGPGNSTEAETAKKAARQLYRDRRHHFVATLDKATREALDRALARQTTPLTSLAEAKAAAIASYASIGDEIGPQRVEQGFGPHAFPRIASRNLTFHLAAWKDLVPGPLGIPQPSETAPQVTPQLLLVPLIAATLGGTRLGQGGGYYDRTLARLRAAGPTIAVGLAWDCQIADVLPTEPHDQLLDWLATPTRLVECVLNR